MVGLFGNRQVQTANVAAPAPMNASALLPGQQAYGQPRRRGLFGGAGNVDLGRALTFLMQGTNGLDRVDARRAAEAAAPQRAADDARLRQIAEGMGPAGLAAYLTNPEQFGQAVSSQLRDEIMAPGSVRNRGGMNIAGAPRIEQTGDVFGVVDPLTPNQVSYTAARPASFAEQTDRMKLDQPISVSQNSDLVTPQGERVYQGQRSPQEIGTGGQLYVQNPDGSYSLAAQNTTPRALSESAQKAVDDLSLTVTTLDDSLGRAQNFLTQLQNNQLNLGLLELGEAEIRNRTNRSNPNSLNIAALRQWADQARDALLRANTGVQTDQDAIRALENIMRSMSDERLVAQYLNQYITATSATRQVLQRGIDRRMGGASPAASPQGSPPPPPPGFVLD